VLSERFDRALAWASELHRGQRRKGTGIPYISHLLAVTALVIEAGGDEDEAIAALLHDAVEDQGGAPVRAEIEQRFGSRVAAIVDGCTDTDQTPKPPWRERKTAFLRALASADRSVQLVVTADKLHNVTCTLVDLRAGGPGTWERFRGRDHAIWYYQSALEALARSPANPLVGRLEKAVAELETL
jgi:(p)ppGpp synthase/HD superfamily hydrolase